MNHLFRKVLGVVEGIPARLTPRQIITAMSGLIIALLLAQLDNMIVAPALPTIVGDLGGLDHLSWVVTGYILASTVATPIWGKLGDLFGHKKNFMAAIIIFLIGSALCGMSQNMTELVLFRAFQGLGAGGLMVGIMSVIGMMVSPRERGKYQGIMMSVMPAAMIGGPLIGGFITDHASWRWVFYVNLPLGVVSLVVVWMTLHLPAEVKSAAKVSIDWLGASVLSVWITSLVLMVTWGGNVYAWGSWQTISLGATAVVGLVVFIAIEQRTAEPIMPLRLFSSSNFSLASALGFVAGFAMFGGITFLPQFQQFVQGQSATNSGLLLMPMMIAAMVFSLGGGLLISKTGRYKLFPLVGTALLAVGLWLFSTMGVDTPTWETSVYMAVLGAGMGCLMQTTNLIAQNSVAIRDLGSATGTSTFTRNMGGSLGVAILGAIYTSQLTSTLTGASTPGSSAPSSSGLTPAALKGMPAAAQSLFKLAVANGTQAIFLCAAVVAVAGFALAWFIKEVPLRDTVAPPAQAVEQVAEELAV
jgi:EmrB/QacA subfamily drug resistance transporter